MKACFAMPESARICAELAERVSCSLVLDFRGTVLEVAATSERLIATLRRVYRQFAAESTRKLALADQMLLIEANSEAADALARRRRGNGPARILDGHLLVANWFPWGMRIETLGLLHYYASKLIRLRVVARWDDEIATLHAASLSTAAG